jgi:hypothetical protein
MVRVAAVAVSMMLLGQAQAAEQNANPDAGAQSSGDQKQAPLPRAKPLRPPRNRGSWDVPKINTIYGQQSATYEDVIGTRTPMPGIVIPAPPSDEPPPRQRQEEKR